MEWYRVRFVTTRRVVIWLLLETVSMLLLPPLLEAAYGAQQGGTASALIIFLYSIALLYVIVLSEGPRWYIAVYDKALKNSYLKLIEKGVQKVELDDVGAKIYYTNGTQKTFAPQTPAQTRRLKDFTVGWLHQNYMSAVPLRTFCQSCVKPTGTAQGVHVTDWAQSFALFATKAQKAEVRSITVYTGK